MPPWRALCGWRSGAVLGAGLLAAASCCLPGWAELDWRPRSLDEFEVRVDEGAATEAAFHKRFYRAVRTEKTDIGAARTIYRELLAERPETAYLYFKLAQLDFRQRRLKPCIEHLETALEHDPKLRAAYDVLGHIYSFRDRDDELIALYERAVEHIKPDNIKYYLAIGKLHEKHDRSDKAMAVYRRAVAEHPAAYRPWLKLFDLQLDDDDDEADEAYQTFREALEATGGHRALLVGVRDLYLEKGDEARTFELTELLVERFPYNADFWRDFVAALLKAGKAEEARAAFKKSCTTLHGEREYFGRIVLLYEAHGDVDEAIAVYEYGLEREPASLELLVALAMHYQQRGEPDKAAPLHERLLGPLDDLLGAGEPMPVTYLWLGHYYLGREQYQRVRDVSARGLAAAARSPFVQELNLLSGKADYFEHRIQDAVSKFELSAQTRGGSGQAQFFLGMSYRRLGRFKEAVDALRRAVKRSPDNPRLRLQLGLAMKRAGRAGDAQKEFDAALAAIKQAVENSPQSLDERLLLASVLDQVGRTEEAEAEFKRALDLDPDSATALNGLGYMWAEAGKELDEALRLIERALEIEPQNGAIVDSLGWVYFKQGRHTDALRELQRAVKLAPPTAEIYDHLGDTHLALGDETEAIQWWNKALELYPEHAAAVRKKIVEHGGTPSVE